MKYKIVISVDTDTVEAVKVFTNVLRDEILRDLESIDVFNSSNVIYYKGEE